MHPITPTDRPSFFPFIEVSSLSLAWTRFSWFIPYQPHTFSPLWFSYIMVVNALCVHRTGHSLMTDRPVFFLLLFPASAVFWWFFEYFNRFVQNWYYTGIEGMGPEEYSLFSSLAFATVLPGVLSMIDLTTLETGIGKRDKDMRKPLETDKSPFAEFFGKLTSSFDATAVTPAITSARSSAR